MVELVVAGFVILVAFSVIAAVGGLISMILWLLWLPFQIIGWVFKALGVLLLLPLLLPVLLGVAVVAGLGLVLGLIPVLPLVLLVLAIVWLAKRQGRPRTA